ncbi:MAG: DUF1772 domain-containing protein [Antricoccus sp.]
MHTPLEFARSIALLSVGLYAGGVLFVVLAPSTGRLPGPAYVRQWQALNTDYGRAMPPLLLTCVLALIATTALSWHHGPLVLGLGICALVLVVLIMALTVVVMEPLNRTADSWNPDQLPITWQQVRQRWAGLHLVRTILGVSAFACLVLAQAVDR